VNALAGPRAVVGRDDSLAELSGAFAGAMRGEVSAVFVHGEAGIGKSALVREFLRRCDGVQVHRGNCQRFAGESSAYVPFTAVVRSVVRRYGRDGVVAGLHRETIGHLSWLVPDLGPARPDDDGTHEVMGAAILSLVERLSRDEPVVLVLEDVHWADISSWVVIEHLVRNVADVPVLVVATQRGLPPGPDLRVRLSELLRLPSVASLELAPLSREHARALVVARHGDVDGDRLDELYRRSGGNPLFLEALIEQDPRAQRVTGGLLDTLVAPVETLAGPSRALVHALAVGGNVVGPALLSRVTGLAEPDVEAAALPALRADVLIQDPDGLGFRHVLIGEAVYELDMLPGERIRLHAAFARAMTAEPALAPPDLRRVNAEVARHWEAAGQPRLALAALWRAAEEAYAQFASSERFAVLRRLVELWPTVGAPEEVTQRTWGEVLGEAVDAADESGEIEDGLILADRAHTAAREAGDRLLEARVLERRAKMRRRWGLPGSRADLVAAVGLVPEEPPTAVRARLLCFLAYRVWLDRELTEAGRLLSGAEELAARVGDDFAMAAADMVRGVLLAEAGDLAAAERLHMRSRERARRIPSPGLAARSFVEQAWSLERLGRYGDAIRTARDGLPLAREAGRERTLGVGLATVLAHALWSVGRWDEAVEVVDRALELDPNPVDRAPLVAVKGEILCERGDVTAAAALLPDAGRFDAEFDTLAERLRSARFAAVVRGAQGRADDAFAIVLHALEVAGVEREPHLAWPLVALVPPIADATGPRHGTHPRASEVSPALRQVADLAERLPVETPFQRACRASYLRAVAGPDPRRAADVIEAEARAWEDAGQPHPLGWALLRSAEVALSRGDRAVAGDRIQRAAAIADAVNAPRLRTAVASMARRARISLPSDPGRADPAPHDALGVTARELAVLELIAIGMTNRQIAEELFISTKTVGVHVSRVLQKLGVGTRGAAAAAARRHGLIHPFP
jgi:DNA-binding CsgD family transcriptional regulator/tetratricopeptide (TPR) repeat protein